MTAFPTGQGQNTAPSQSVLDLRDTRLERGQEALVTELNTLRQYRGPRFYLDRNGLPQLKPTEKGFFDTVGDRLKRGALDVFVDDPSFVDALLFDFATTFAGESNARDMDRLSLYQQEGDLLFNFNTEEFQSQENLTTNTLLEYLNPAYLFTLQQGGVDLDPIKEMDLDVAEKYIKREILRTRLNEEIEYNIDNRFERYATGGLAIASQFIDPSLFIGGGVGVAGRKLGAYALRKLAKEQTSHWALRAAAGTTTRLRQNSSISGAVLDNKFTRNHAAAFIGVDTAVVSTGFDLYTQKKENETFEYYFGETGAPWWSPERSLLAGTVGMFFGYGVGKVFGVENAHIEGRKRIEEVLNTIAPDVPESIRNDVLNSWETNIGKIRQLVDADGSIDNKEAYAQAVNDMVESLLPLYDNARNLDGDRLPSEVLRELIDDAIETQTILFREPTDADIELVNNEIFEIGKERDFVHDELVELREQRSSVNRNIELDKTGDARFYLKDELKYLDNKIADLENKLIQINDAERAAVNKTSELNDRLANARTAKANGVDGSQVQANVINTILDYMSERPTYTELKEFLSPESGFFTRLPSEKRKQLREINKRRNELNKELDDLQRQLDAQPDNSETRARFAILNNVSRVEDKLRELDINQEVNYNRRIHPEVRDTKFRQALDLKQEAAQRWVEVKDIRDPVKRQEVLQQIEGQINRANNLLEATRRDIIQRVGVTNLIQDQLAREFDAVVLGHQVRKVSAESRQQAQRILEAHYIEAGNPRPRIRNRTALNRFLYDPVVTKLSSITTSRGDLEAIVQESPEMMTLIELISPITNATRSHNPGKEYVNSMNSELRRLDGKAGRLIVGPLKKIYKQYKDPEVRVAKQIDAYRLAFAGDPSNDPLVQELAKGIKTIYEDFEIEARRTGKLLGSDSNYIHTQLLSNLDSNPEGKALLVNKYHEWILDKYNPDKDGVSIHRATLADAGIIAATGDNQWSFGGVRIREGESLSFKEPGTKNIIELSDLNRTFTEAELGSLLNRAVLKKLEVNVGDNWRNVDEIYVENFHDAARREAVNAIENRNRADRDASKSFGTSESPHDIQVKRSEIASAQRQIPLEIIFDREVLESGIVELDPLLNVRHYWASFGYEVMEQKLMEDLLGVSGVTLEDFLEYALRKHSAEVKARGGTPYKTHHYNTIRNLIMGNRNQLAGRHFSAAEESGITTGILQAISQLTSIPVNANIPFLMPTTEILMPALLHVMTSKGKVKALTTMLKSFSESLSRSERLAMGKTVREMQLAQRVTAESGLFTDEVAYTYWDRLRAPWIRVKRAAVDGGEAATFRGRNAFSNTLVASTEALAETTRSLSGELPLTAMGQTMFAKYHARMIGDNLDKIERAAAEWAKIGDTVTDKQLKGIARHSGLKLEDLQDYIQNGIITKSGIELHFLRLMKQNGATDFGDIDNVYRIIQDTFEGARRQVALEHWERVVDTINYKIDRDITNPGVFDRPVHQANAIVAFISRYLSFARGFRAGKMQDLANAGIATATLGLMGYYLSELVNRSLIANWMHNESIDDIVDKWEENPGQMTVYSLNSLPFLGGFNSIASAFVESMVTGRAPSPSYAPAISIFDSQMRSMWEVIFGEPDEQDWARFRKNFPFLNHSLTQVILKAFQEENDSNGDNPLGP